ncbi:D-alanyl-D-alanine carboxypeptidase/D-alanyl-D-alanine-endopeptidase [Marinilongibacter aquaticus]|uniref:D-alanyl-D-alanine carboxypeptidase/D-alanyl-D-alanine endopeptidase n=1 Tax=Marinilongibacter aquaticus TaxID=2975157 RepID=UPI0021BDCB9A|nr:D-alanyl-D-alanine carboxypeptidase/D-alanyl-D-alanine-endopeptidase [Marinilongibacter aquaticus]UBM59797.1 D-alanyl-D-alanine carboxypeptidase/D-alanyl-D-alanine-endopeptidase [Marinilongibacter aquaticus]
MTAFAFILLQLTSIQNQILHELQAFQNQPGISHGIVAASVRRVSDNKEMIAFNENKAINSASTLKLITTATALSILGPDYRYETKLAYTGKIDEGKLQGDLLLLPSGDPTLGSERGGPSYTEITETVVQAVKNAGIEKIEGNLIIKDPSLYNYDLPDSWSWGDIGNYYGAIPHTFNIHENFFNVFFQPGNTLGAEASINALVPFDNDWKIINQVKTGPRNSGDQVYIYSSPSAETLLMKGTVPLGESNFLVKGSIPDPSKLFRKQLLGQFESEGVEIVQAGILPTPSDLGRIEKDVHILHTFTSDALEEIARQCNFHSINLYADALLHSLSKTEFLSFDEGLKTYKAYWEEKGLATDGFNPRDGSGLSQTGLVTAKCMTDILCTMGKSPYFDAYYSTIAVFGKDGSVRYKDPKKLTQGRMRTKSGYINGTRAYAGYFTDKAGEQYAYMFCVNRYNDDARNEVRRFLDNLLLTMGSH